MLDLEVKEHPPRRVIRPPIQDTDLQGMLSSVRSFEAEVPGIGDVACCERDAHGYRFAVTAGEWLRSSSNKKWDVDAVGRNGHVEGRMIPLEPVESPVVYPAGMSAALVIACQLPGRIELAW